MPSQKAVYLFLILTFGLTIAVSLLARAFGVSFFGAVAVAARAQLVVAGAMFFPALSAILVHKFLLKRLFKELGFRWGDFKSYAKAYGIIVGLFMVNYAIVYLFLLKPDFSLRSFFAQFSGVAVPISTSRLIVLLSLATFIGAPILNLIPSLGEEIGWRGFLLPNLEPLGRRKAAVLSGMVWALWHTPLIFILGFFYGNQAWPGALLHFSMVTGLGIWFAHVWFGTRSTVLAAFMHATFNGNFYGIWTMLFVSSNKLLIGPAGAIGAALALILGLFYLREIPGGA
jgi:membrane protease YdiL (CAAX protease family)